MVEVLKSILHFFEAVVTWVVTFFQWLAVKVFTLIFDALVAVLSLIPVPEWLSSISGNISGLSGGILFFIEPFQLGTGLSWIVSAYLLRFLIRRIPVIG